MANMKLERRLSFVLMFMILGLMALGAGVRTMGAGLACPDWPLCFGKVIPDFHIGVYFEFIHRAYAGLVSLVFFFLLYRLWTNPKATSAMRWFATGGVFVLLLQIIMGGLTVLKLLHFGIVAAHLTLATIFLLCVMATWVLLDRASRPEPAVVRAAMPGSIAAALATIPVIVFAQIVLGGAVASTYAGLMCVDFPLCQGQWVPTLRGPIGLQVMHRFLAYFIAIFVFGLALVMHRYRNAEWMTAKFRNQLFSLVGLVLLQIVVGVANLVMLIPPWLTVLHQLVAMLILLASVRLATLLKPAAFWSRADLKTKLTYL